MVARLGSQIIPCERHKVLETRAAKEITMTKIDSQLQNDVMAELKWQPEIDSSHIGVAAQNNVITLSGQVAHYNEKRAAEASAKSV